MITIQERRKIAAQMQEGLNQLGNSYKCIDPDDCAEHQPCHWCDEWHQHFYALQELVTKIAGYEG